MRPRSRSRYWGPYETTTATPTKTPLENINLHFQNCFAFILTSSTCIMWPNYPGAEFVENRGQVQIEKGNFTVVCLRSLQNLEFGHFTSLFCRERQRNVPKRKMHVQVIVFLTKTYCFAAFSLPSPS